MSNDYILVDKSFQIVIAPDVYDLWLNHRQLTQESCESFGVLIGSKSLSQETYWLNQITEPMSKDKHTRCSFILTDKGHQAIVDEAYRDSNGQCVYFGTWHTHPQKIPIASSVDYHDWSECIARNPDRKLFFVIVGLEQLRIYFYQNEMFKFIKLKITA